MHEDRVRKADVHRPIASLTALIHADMLTHQQAHMQAYARACTGTRTCTCALTHAHQRIRTHIRTNVFARAQVSNPLEPLMMSLVRGFVDDDDLNKKLCALYQVERNRDRRFGCESHSYVVVCGGVAD